MWPRILGALAGIILLSAPASAANVTFDDLGCGSALGGPYAGLNFSSNFYAQCDSDYEATYLNAMSRASWTSPNGVSNGATGTSDITAVAPEAYTSSYNPQSTFNFLSARFSTFLLGDTLDSSFSAYSLRLDGFLPTDSFETPTFTTQFDLTDWFVLHTLGWMGLVRLAFSVSDISADILGPPENLHWGMDGLSWLMDDVNTSAVSIEPTEVPEPATLALVWTGLVALARRRKFRDVARRAHARYPRRST